MTDTDRLALVLVVDDQEPNVRAVGSLLARNGFDVAPCLSGAEALERLSEVRPHLMLLDMRMPGMDGFEVLERLRADEVNRDLPVIFLTAEHDRDALVRAFSSGAVDYITKPFVPEELLARVRTHTALKLARDRLAALAVERQENLDLIAHDLRNHFTNILFAAELLATDGDSPARLRQVENLRGASQSGLMFLQAVLDQAADEARGDIVEPLPAAALLQEAADAYVEQAGGKQMRIELQADRFLLVRGQRMALQHVLRNLVSNAVKYAPPGSVVTLCAVAHGKRARFLVMDRGPGIAADEQAALFRRFSTLSNRPTGGETSTGLGLALAKQKSRAMGGDLWYDDRSEGGACFTLELPRVE
ncbi:hybrid sensor histidine kinase/response regulator [Arenimonas alkanexedens]